MIAPYLTYCAPRAFVGQAGDAAVSISGVVRHSSRGIEEVKYPFGVSIRRGDAAMVLLNKAASFPNVKVHTGTKFKSMDIDSRYHGKLNAAH